MFVRTTYATGDPATLDEAVQALTTEGRRQLAGEPGFRGAGMFADRELGKLVTGTWWEDEAAMRASADRMEKVRAQVLSSFATTVTVDNWEAAVAARAESVPEGARFRLVRLDLAPSDADSLVDAFENGVLPRLRTMTGFLGGSLLVDRAAGRGAVGTLYADKDSLAASRSPVAALRGEATSRARATLRSLEEFEVVMVESPPPS
ncbi:antibiotic biosynthesis monooxygenase [Streptomyces sp. ISL-10]|uniref:antibiotic biosynthesis monooxygenase n=1 Tax=Streptomyces sp. ISL-10 TaxID=2819172 RepID=UPI001BEBDFEC|nr:antibiotic biosynthesis monooxygenase [Streptomyces sp. ISL-10]MBT2368767.1 antibiotic biosynthesis monooxygenase [Streptomyces sp. ISL-10]